MTAQGTIVYGPIADVDLAVGVGGITNSAPGGGSIIGNRINLSTFAFTGKLAWAPAAVPINNVITADVSCVGARVGFYAIVSFDGILGHQNHNLHAEVVVPDHIYVFLTNNDAVNPLTVGPGTLRALCFPVPLT